MVLHLFIYVFFVHFWSKVDYLCFCTNFEIFQWFIKQLLLPKPRQKEQQFLNLKQIKIPPFLLLLLEDFLRSLTFVE